MFPMLGVRLRSALLSAGLLLAAVSLLEASSELRSTFNEGPAYAKPLEPLAIHRKTKPSNGNDLTFDFHDFSKPGTYRIHVPGIGVSGTFGIAAESTWAEAFRTSMHGLLSHRSGIRLGPPFTTYERPRPMHPEDGDKGPLLNILSCDRGRITDLRNEDVPLGFDQRVFLSAEIDHGKIQFFHGTSETGQHPIGPVLDGTILSDEHADWGFTGCFVGMCCQDKSGRGTAADFDFFHYQEKEDIP